MSELNVIIIVSVILFFSAYIVVKRYKDSKDKKIKFVVKQNEKKINVAKDYYSTFKPKDFNDKQVMTKYNKGTYRNEKGQYASLKQ